jgi:hypothetical protein
MFPRGFLAEILYALLITTAKITIIIVVVVSSVNTIS